MGRIIHSINSFSLLAIFYTIYRVNLSTVADFKINPVKHYSYNSSFSRLSVWLWKELAENTHLFVELID